MKLSETQEGKPMNKFDEIQERCERLVYCHRNDSKSAETHVYEHDILLLLKALELASEAFVESNFVRIGGVNRPKTQADIWLEQAKKELTIIASVCKQPGLCECPDMKRCPGCGYTQHDKDYWLDHSYCSTEEQECPTQKNPMT